MSVALTTRRKLHRGPRFREFEQNMKAVFGEIAYRIALLNEWRRNNRQAIAEYSGVIIPGLLLVLTGAIIFILSSFY